MTSVQQFKISKFRRMCKSKFGYVIEILIQEPLEHAKLILPTDSGLKKMRPYQGMLESREWEVGG